MKKKLLFLMTFVITAFAWDAKAQTDVTSTYLTNADFESSTPISSDLRGYGKDMVSGDLYGFQPVDGWTYVVTNGDNSNASYPNSAMGAAVFAYGSTNLMRGNNVSAPATDPDGNAGNCLGFFGIWECGGYYYQDVTFPAGEYTINIPVYNQSGTSATTTYFGFIPNSGTSQTIATPTTTGSWVTLTKTFTLAAETAGKICVGYQSKGSGSGVNPHLFIDKVQILYTATVVKDVLANAITAATKVNATLNDSDLAAAISTAQTVYDSTTASQDEVNDAADTLNAVMMSVLSAAGDVSFLFSNLGFEDCTVTTTNAAAGSSAAPLDISGEWTQVQSSAWSSSAVVAYEGTGQVNGASAPSADNLGNTGNTLGISVGWGGTVTYKSSTATLPAGSYTITFNAYNNLSGFTQFASKNGFVATSGTSHLSTKTSFAYGEWVTDVVKFNLDEATEGYIQVGGTAVSGGSGSNAKVFFDNVTVTYQSFLDAAKAAWDEAYQAADAATNDGAYDNITGGERTALNAELAKSEPTTVEGYEEATAALQEATAAFIAAAPTYDALVREISKATALGVDADTTNAAQDIADSETTTAADALAATQTLKVAEYEYVSTDFQYGVELGGWDTEGPTGTKTGQHWADGNGEYLEQSTAAWSQTAWTIKYSQYVSLPAGNYIFKVAGRKAAGDGVTMSLIVKNGDTVLGTVSDFPEGDTGLGINTDGETDYDESHTYANGNAGRGWEWRYVKFSISEETQVNVAVEAVATTNHQWVSFCDATVQTDNDANIALIDYYVARGDAWMAQNDDQYVNVAGQERAALDEVIAADATLDKTNKEEIEDLTVGLRVATEAFIAAKESYDNLAYAVFLAETAVDATRANVGTGVFQIPENALETIEQAILETQDVQLDIETTAAIAEQAMMAIVLATEDYESTELNAPADGQRFKLVLSNNGGWTYDGKAATFVAGGRTDAGTYNISYLDDVEAYEHSFTFTKVEGNNYTISQTDIDGNERYICTGTVYGGNNSQIRSTTDPENAAQFTVIPTATEGIYNIKNVVANQYVGSQDVGVYTVNSHINFQLVEVQKVPVALSFTDDINYATRIFPFAPELPEGVKAYTCESLNDETLELTEVAEPAANVPYILGSENALSVEVEGWPLASSLTYENGLLTGVYTNTNAPVGSYVLQHLNGTTAFYIVEEGNEPTVTPYRAYLTAPAETDGIKAINFPGNDATAIEAIEALTSGNAEIYNAAGVRINRMEKGLNIVRTADGKVKKVLVK